MPFSIFFSLDQINLASVRLPPFFLRFPWLAMLAIVVCLRTMPFALNRDPASYRIPSVYPRANQTLLQLNKNVQMQFASLSGCHVGWICPKFEVRDHQSFGGNYSLR